MRTAWLFLFLLPALGAGVLGQDGGHRGPGTANGAYTEAQAMRGHVNFDNNCSECHVSDLSGRAGPPLKGDVFLERWRGKTAGSLFDKIKTTMPADRRTQLNDARTLDLVAFLLQQNGFSAGDQDLDVDTAEHIRIDDQSAR